MGLSLWVVPEGVIPLVFLGHWTEVTSNFKLKLQFTDVAGTAGSMANLGGPA